VVAIAFIQVIVAKGKRIFYLFLKYLI